MKSLKILLNHMTGNVLTYLGAILSVGFATLFATMLPLVIQITIDSVIGNHPLSAPLWLEAFILRLGGIETLRSSLWVPGVMVVSITLLRGLFLFLKGKWAAQSSESIAKNLREKLYDHLQHLPYKYHVQAETGDLIQRCTSDVDTIRRFLGYQFVEVGNSLFTLGFAIYIMLSLDLRMTLISIAAVPLIFIFAVVFFRKVKKAFQLSDEAEAAMTTVLQENLTGVRVVRAFANQAYEIEKFEQKNKEYSDLTYRLIWLLACYWAASDLLALVQIAAVLLVGIYYTVSGAITLGTLVVFSTYVGMLLWPARQLGRILTDMGKALVAAQRIQDILDEPIEEMEVTGQTPQITGDIVFEDVHFEYEAGKPVLNGISFQVKAGQTIGVLGHTGSGKSSLIQLLGRLYDYQKGSIRIDGHELNTLDKKWVRKNVGIVPQEPFLFAKTIKENIALAVKGATDHEIETAAKEAAVHDVIMKFDKGYDTLVGERGVSVSGGQRQRIAIARALISNTPIVIFDDSLSAVDTETDVAIRNALRMRKSNSTTIIISHRIASLSEADLIIVLDHGRIIDQGTHQELSTRPGIYQKVWEMQNQTGELPELLSRGGAHHEYA